MTKDDQHEDGIPKDKVQLIGGAASALEDVISEVIGTEVEMVVIFRPKKPKEGLPNISVIMTCPQTSAANMMISSLESLADIIKEGGIDPIAEMEEAKNSKTH